MPRRRSPFRRDRVSLGERGSPKVRSTTSALFGPHRRRGLSLETLSHRRGPPDRPESLRLGPQHESSCGCDDSPQGRSHNPSLGFRGTGLADRRVGAQLIQSPSRSPQAMASRAEPEVEPRTRPVLSVHRAGPGVIPNADSRATSKAERSAPDPRSHETGPVRSAAGLAHWSRSSRSFGTRQHRASRADDRTAESVEHRMGRTDAGAGSFRFTDARLSALSRARQPMPGKILS